MDVKLKKNKDKLWRALVLSFTLIGLLAGLFQIATNQLWSEMKEQRLSYQQIKETILEVDEIEKIEWTLLETQDDAFREKENRLKTIITIGGVIRLIVIFIIALFLIKVLNMFFREQNQYESQLKDNETRLANFLYGTNAGTWEWNVQTGETEFNERWGEIIGYSLEELSPVSIETWLKFAHPEDLKSTEVQLQRVFSKEIQYYIIECRMKHKDGHWVWVQDRGRVISWTEEGKPLLMSGTHIDVTEQKLLGDNLYESTEKYKSIVEISNTGVWEYDIEKDCLWCSDAYFKMLGHEPGDYPVSEVNNLEKVWINLIHPEDVDDASEKFKDFFTLATDDFYDNHFRMKNIDGEWVWIWSRGKIVKDHDNKKGKLVVGTHIDITEIKRAQEIIEHLSYYDHLTKLHNRRHYEDKLKEYFGEEDCQISLVIIDVNGLKLVNDAFGHFAGDQLLMKVGEILAKNTRIEDTVARIGGDEFVILLPKLDDLETAEMVNRMMIAFDKEKVQNIPVSVSSGWATKQKKEDSLELIFKRAEDMMYHNKITERNSFRHQSIQIIMQTLIEKTPREEAHSQRVSELCVSIGKEVDLSSVELKSLQTAGLLHDIGKIGISNDILDKKGSLNEEEWLEIKKHPQISYNILSSVNEYGPLADIVLSHHERWDGKGYPNGLMGEAIPINARIIALADAYDAMVSDRAYRKGMEKEKALKIIESEAGKQFDPDLVKIFLERVMKNYI